MKAAGLPNKPLSDSLSRGSYEVQRLASRKSLAGYYLLTPPGTIVGTPMTTGGHTHIPSLTTASRCYNRPTDATVISASSAKDDRILWASFTNESWF